MAEHMALARTGSDDDFGFDLDLRDEECLLAAHRAEYDVEGVRALLAAVNLRPIGLGPNAEGAGRASGEVMDLAVFRATGSHSLARLFGSIR